MEGGSERMAAGLTRLKAAAAGGKGRFLLATFQVRQLLCSERQPCNRCLSTHTRRHTLSAPALAATRSHQLPDVCPTRTHVTWMVV
jgi:hypothetical protein